MAQKRFFRLLLCLMLLVPLVAGNSAPVLPASEAVDEGGCNLPAPMNLHTVSVGSNTATIAWDSVNTAWGYYVTLSQGGNPPSASGNTTATSMTFTDLDEGTYTVKVYPKCSLYSTSPQYAQLNFSTIIIDLICSATGNSGTTVINGSNNIYTWPWGVTQHYFVYVTYNNSTAKFQFDRLISPEVRFTFSPVSGNPSNFKLGRTWGEGNDNTTYCNDEGAEGTTGEVKIKYDQTVVASCYFLRNNQMEVDPSSGATIVVKYTNYEPAPIAPGSPPKAGDGSTAALPTPQPNPFSDLLYLSGGAPGKPVQGALYDACGRCVRQFDYDQSGLMTIPTDDLQPGMYFLQLRSPSGNTMHKLLKL
ncbi:MAG: T9SS type A sorting domain-containing protein [Saprospiraceae bacterium]|nr:T9SS type A sorting domain-containing protein [Saprospiraceae bacterium]